MKQTGGGAGRGGDTGKMVWSEPGRKGRGGLVTTLTHNRTTIGLIKYHTGGRVLFSSYLSHCSNLFPGKCIKRFPSLVAQRNAPVRPALNLGTAVHFSSPRASDILLEATRKRRILTNNRLR